MIGGGCDERVKSRKDACGCILMMANQHFGVQPIAYTISLSLFSSLLPDPPNPGCFPSIATPSHCEVVGGDSRDQLLEVFLTKTVFVVILDGVAEAGPAW